MKIEASIRLLPQSEGGRSTPIVDRYSPHLIVESKTEMLGVRFLLGAHQIKPGESASVECETIYDGAVDYSSLKEGVAFRIVEGPKTIGLGTVRRTMA